MKLGLDCVAAPTFPQLQAMIGQSGATWLCAYIGGPTALGTGWTADAHRALSPLLADGFLPTYAGVGWGGPFTADRGRMDGEQAVMLLQGAGFPASGSPLVLDLEYAAYEAGKGAGIEDYCAAWVDRVRNAGAVPVLYSSEAGCTALAPTFAHVWVASWRQLASPPEPPPEWTYWQYGGGTLAGIAVDLNTAQDAALFARPVGTQPEPEPVAIDQGWLDKKPLVVQAAGELQTVAAQLLTEANRRNGPRVTVVRQLAGDVRQRADGILA